MKKILLMALCLWLVSCAQNDSPELTLLEYEAVERSCASHTMLQQQLQNNPALQTKMDDIENFIQNKMNTKDKTLLANNTVIQIPVVVNVVWNKNEQNISLEQIKSQIDALNRDFGGINEEYNRIPAEFSKIAAGSINMSFVLDKVNRKQTVVPGWKTNDDVKKNAKGGMDPTNPKTKLNIWVCNLTGNVLGYAQYPGGDPNTDGIVIDDNAFGTTGTAKAPFNKGRTTVHEIGHWLNLKHIWGDASCGNDLVNDTPKHNTANYGCPAYPHQSTCSTKPIEMTMNYMDYTHDDCMYMFTAGQKSRMNVMFYAGGPRNSFQNNVKTQLSE